MFTLGSCLICEAFLFREDILCGFCWKNLERVVRARGLIQRSHPVFVESLWSWNADNEEISRRLIYGMKGRSDPAIWRKFAVLFMAQRTPLPMDACLVPIPSKRSPEGDHAFGFARALQGLTGWPIETCLTSPPQPHQRSRTRQERRRIHIVKHKRVARAYSAYILIDDVVTSGATLEAAFRALRKPPQAFAWCFMDRPLVFRC